MRKISERNKSYKAERNNEIYKKWLNGYKVIDLATEYGVSCPSISRIVRNEFYRDYNKLIQKLEETIAILKLTNDSLKKQNENIIKNLADMGFAVEEMVENHKRNEKK